MPTGYTAQLMERNYNLRDWLMNDLIRGLGISIMLRDDGRLSDGEIETRLALTVSEAEADVQKAEATLARVQTEIDTVTPEQWKSQYEKHVLDATAENDKRKAEYKQHRSAHLLALEKLQLLQKQVMTEVGVGLIKFAVDQIERVVNFDYSSGPYESPTSRSLDAYIVDESLSRVEHAKSQHKYAVECLTRAQERLSGFQAVAKEIEAIFPSGIKQP